MPNLTPLPNEQADPEATYQAMLKEHSRKLLKLHQLKQARDKLLRLIKPANRHPFDVAPAAAYGVQRLPGAMRQKELAHLPKGTPRIRLPLPVVRPPVTS